MGLRTFTVPPPASEPSCNLPSTAWIPNTSSDLPRTFTNHTPRSTCELRASPRPQRKQHSPILWRRRQRFQEAPGLLCPKGGSHSLNTALSSSQTKLSGTPSNLGLQTRPLIPSSWKVDKCSRREERSYLAYHKESDMTWQLETNSRKQSG